MVVDGPGFISSFWDRNGQFVRDRTSRDETFAIAR